MASTSLQDDPLLGRIVDTRYKVVGRIREGGMGVIYRAVQLTIGREVVLKVIHPEKARRRKSVQRFLLEAKVIGQLQHPNIVQLHDFGETEDGRLYIVMEYVPGRTLRELLREEGNFTVARTINIAIQVLDALGEAHLKGVIHRDLKPENVMVIQGPLGRDVVKLLDFGLAKLTRYREYDITKVGTVLGTPRYMSPEQAKSSRVDNRADLYSLGVLMLEMLVGELPYSEKGTSEVLRLVRAGASEPLEQTLDQFAFPPPLSRVARSCLAHSREDRPADARKLMEMLETAVAEMGPQELVSRVVPTQADQTKPSRMAQKVKRVGRRLLRFVRKRRSSGEF